MNRSTLRPAAPRSAADRARQAATVAERLAEAHPEARCSLDFATPFQLLVATILSAQCTDKRVNAVTGALFRRWPTPQAMAAAEQPEIEEMIHSTGFFRAKAKNIRACCQALIDRHGGEVPESLEALVKLPGVGRKTANVVLGCAFHTAVGVVVDTHVGRLSRRLGLTRHTDAVRAERDLIAAVPQPHWIGWSHRLIEHGRGVCSARAPRCGACLLADICPRIGVQPAAGKHSRGPMGTD